MPVNCDFCGTRVESDAPPLTWVTSMEHGKQRVFCDRCARDNLRAIESKLDNEWW